MGHIFKNKIRILLRSKSTIFWTLIFPMVLALFFNIAFSNIYSEEEFEPVKVGIIEDQNFEDEETFKEMMKELSKDNDDQVFISTYYKSERKAKKELKDNDIVGYYKINDEGDAEVIVKENGLEPSIMKQVVDSYYQTYDIADTLAELNPQALMTGALEDMNKEGDYFTNASPKKVDPTVMYFYTLLAMACMYGGFFGTEAVKDSEANLSSIGARNSVSPTHKMKNLMASVLAGVLVQYAEMLVFIAFLLFVLGIEFGNQLGCIMILTLLGTVAGVGFGAIIGASNRRSENAKVGILISVTMACCVLGGMMSQDIRFVIKDNLPVLDAINPISMISDGFYALYCYSDLAEYNMALLRLAIFAIVVVVATYFFVRRKKYDSI